jgi:hypothetical protein
VEDAGRNRKKESKNNNKVWGWMLVAGALILLAVGGYPFIKQIILDTAGEETSGTVVEIYGEGWIKAPIVQFVANNGSEYTFK